MNNFSNCLEIEKINSQLVRANIQKRRLISNIYQEYEFYLDLVRDLLLISVENGLNELFSDPSIKLKKVLFNAKEPSCSLENNIRKLIYNNLPLITVEQLKINKIKKNVNKEIIFNNSVMSLKSKDYQKEEFQFEDIFELEQPLKFKISDDISNTSEYYQTENNYKFVSVDLDNNNQFTYLSNDHIFENIGIEKEFISSLLELADVVKVENPIHFDNPNPNHIDITSEYQNLKNFDLIDNSLKNLLLNLSYNINQELFKSNVIKKMLSQDSFDYLVGKKLMIKHPHPFVINLEFKFNQSLSKLDNIPSIIFFNISTVELEFKNLNLSIQRNKINELKNQFQDLIKKERYWRQKEISFNKIR